MDKHVLAIWQKLESLQISPMGSAFTFEQRLARENGWSIEFANRVVHEYKRFLLLCAVTGRPVTPSDEVDQAWHLHLVYTQSYWGELCGKVLGYPLHHGPTQGGSMERSRYSEQYLDTLVAYQKIFDTTPPEDIWPTVEKRFEHIDFRRINTHRYWVVPKLGIVSHIIPYSLIIIGAGMVITNLWLNKDSLRAIGLLLAGCGLTILAITTLVRASNNGTKGNGGGCGSGCGGCGGCGGD